MNTVVDKQVIGDYEYNNKYNVLYDDEISNYGLSVNVEDTYPLIIESYSELDSYWVEQIVRTAIQIALKATNKESLNDITRREWDEICCAFDPDESLFDSVFDGGQSFKQSIKQDLLEQDVFNSLQGFRRQAILIESEGGSL